MRSGTILNRYELFAAAAVIAAHANAGENGFRQRDVRFLFQLFSNWVEQSLGSSEIPLKNTQILRYLESLVEDGFAKAMRDKKQPLYRLTRVGLLDLVTRIVQKREERLPDQVYFLSYFLTCYRDRLMTLVASEGTMFPNSLRLEIEALLDVRTLLSAEIERLDREIERLSARIHQSREAGELAAKLYRDHTPHFDVVRVIQERYPYELNSQKPLTELLSEVPPALGRWEMEVGNIARSELLWRPSLELLKAHRLQLDRLRRQGVEQASSLRAGVPDE